MSDADAKSVVILGGGVSGLGAAYRLLQLRPGWRVTVLEQGPVLGGLACSFKCGEFKADLGPHRIYTELPEIEKLLPELIQHTEIVQSPRRSKLLLNGHFFDYPIRAGELLREMGIAKMTRFAASAAVGKLSSLVSHPSSFEEAMRGAFGSAVYSMLVGPYTHKVWKEDPARISTELARVRVSAGGVTQLIKQVIGRQGGKGSASALASVTYIKGGVEKLVDSLAQKVQAMGGELRTGAVVTDLDVGENGVTSVGVSGVWRVEADAVISTIPVTQLGRMLLRKKQSPSASAAVGKLEYLGMHLVAVVVNRPQVTGNTWLYFPDGDVVFNRAYEPRCFDPTIPESDRAPIVFEVTWREGSDLASADDIARRVCRDAVRIGMFSEAEIQDVCTVSIDHAYPLYRIGFEKELQSVLEYLRQFPNLITTGRQGLFNHNNMDHSMLMGLRAAETLDSFDSPAEAWENHLPEFSRFRIVD